MPISCMFALPINNAPAAREPCDRGGVLYGGLPAQEGRADRGGIGRLIHLILDRHRHAVKDAERLTRRKRAVAARACAITSSASLAMKAREVNRSHRSPGSRPAPALRLPLA